jgi:hypothetical protein
VRLGTEVINQRDEVVLTGFHVYQLQKSSTNEVHHG